VGGPSERAHGLYQDMDSRPTLLVAALRGPYHLTELAGAELIMSVHPKYQAPFDSPVLAKLRRIGSNVPAQAIRRQSRCREFLRTYEPDGLQAQEFLSFGLTQRTLTQFSEIGWKQIETLPAPPR